MTTPERGQSRLRRFAGTGLAGLLIAAALLAASQSAALGPYPDLGGCPVFPAPPASLPASSPSLPTEAAWNQDVSKAPLARNSAATIAYIDAHGGDRLHPDFGSPRAYGFPYSIVGAGQGKLPIRYTAYGDESDPGPFPIPKGAPVEGGSRSDGDRHVLVVDRSTCTLYELYRAFFKRSGAARTIAIALKRYGAIVADNGSNWYFGGTSDRRWDDADLDQLKRIPGSAFQVVKSAAAVHAC